MAVLELEVDAPDIHACSDFPVPIGAMVPGQVTDLCAVLVVATDLGFHFSVITELLLHVRDHIGQVIIDKDIRLIRSHGCNLDDRQAIRHVFPGIAALRNPLAFLADAVHRLDGRDFI